MRDLAISFPINVRLALEDVDIADAVIVARFVDREHLVDELAVHEVVHVEDRLELWEVLELTPRFRSLVGYDWCICLLLWLAFVASLALLDHVFVDVAQHSLVLAVVKYL